jgi:ribA/ribD-fused uncharacterized protein
MLPTPYSKDSISHLLDAQSVGTKFEFLFFYGHAKAPDGRGSFSQWFPSPFTVDGNLFQTAEHWMMFSKAKLFGDIAACADVLATDDPYVAKSIGRQVRGFDQAMWDEHCFELVVQGNMHKFQANQEIKSFLRGTGSKVLVEASPFDRIWGIGLSHPSCQAKTWRGNKLDDLEGNESNGGLVVDLEDVRKWKGLNYLGFALMEVRRRLLNA